MEIMFGDILKSTGAHNLTRWCGRFVEVILGDVTRSTVSHPLVRRARRFVENIFPRCIYLGRGSYGVGENAGEPPGKIGGGRRGRLTEERLGRDSYEWGGVRGARAGKGWGGLEGGSYGVGARERFKMNDTLNPSCLEPFVSPVSLHLRVHPTQGIPNGDRPRDVSSLLRDRVCSGEESHFPRPGFSKRGLNTGKPCKDLFGERTGDPSSRHSKN